MLDELGAVAGAQSRATIPASSAVVSSISSGGQAAYASDPSTSISQYMAYKNSSDKYDAGTSVLVSLETDEVASVEYWLYLEGCDEQCFNPVQNKDAGLMLALLEWMNHRRESKMKQAFRNWFCVSQQSQRFFQLTAATYAWFTSNQAVSTTRASARTAEESLELQISSDGSTFSNASPVSIAQVNQTSLTNLLPVSTADLTNFVYAPSTVSDMAVTFEPVTDEQYYYHGRIYLRALAQGLSSDTTLSLYLDQTDGLLGKDVNGTLLNAARLGLVFNNDYSSSVILRLSDSQNASSQQVFNTVVGGVTLGFGQVLSWNKSGVQAVADPSVLVTDYTVSFSASDMSVPQKPLCVMNLNQIYTVDVYFYLEGCDPDCSESITHNEADLYLAFYGISGRKGDR